MNQKDKTNSTHPVNSKKLSVLYCILMASYWAGVCCVTGFSSTFLLGRGFSSSLIGITLAIGNIIAVIVAPRISALADRSQKIKVHHLVILSSALALVSFGVLFFIKSPVAVVFVLFVLSVSLIQILQPLTNSVSVYYTSRGIDINFGASRAMGSAAYGILSSLLGILVTRFGVSVIPVAGVAMVVIMIIVTLALPLQLSEQAFPVNTASSTVKSTSTAEAASAVEAAAAEEDAAPSTGFLTFCKRYPRFMLMLLGLVLIFIFHNIANNYLMQLSNAIGGDATTMGYALTLQAFIELPPMLLFGRLLKKFGSKKLLAFSAVFFAIKALGFTLVHTPAMLFAVMLLQMLCYAIYIPASVAYVGEAVKEEDQFQGQAMIVSATTMGGVFGSLLGGVLIDGIGVFATMRVCFFICLVGAGVVLVALFTRKKMANK